MLRFYAEDEDTDAYDLRQQVKRERRAFKAVMRCKGDPCECSCPNCNPPDDDFDDEDE